MRTNFKHYFLVMMLAVLCSTISIAQTVTGGVTGTITDPSGAVITGAKVTATNLATNVTTTTTTNKDGVYSIRFLTIGEYKVAVEMPGFTTQSLGPFALESGQTAKFDAKMTLEGAATSISVNESLVPLLNTENAELGTTLDTTAIENIPLTGRNFQELALYTPGAISTNPTSFGGADATERTNIGGSQLSVNGNRAQTNNFLLDGFEINETINNTVGYNPSPDALSQVRVVSANAQAEYGNVNGGDVIALLKNGTNKFHGSAFFFLQNYKMNANSWSNNHAGNPKGSSTSSIFGGTLGGPIIKDRLFFFGDYEGTRSHSGGVGTVAVATALMRQGDFSELLDPALNCLPGTPCTANRLTQLYDSQNGFKPFVGNRGVPITNPAAIFLYAHPELYPLPNRTPTAGSPTADNYQGPRKSRTYNNQFDVRIDYKVSEKDSFFGSYSQSVAGDTSTAPLVLQFPGASRYPTRGFGINYIRTITPSVLNEFRAGYFRIVWNQGIPNDTTGVFGMKGNSVLGIEGGNQVPGFAQLSISGIATLGNSGVYSDIVMNNYTYGDNLTWQKGTHTFKFGAQFIRYQQNIIYSGLDGAGGTIGFNGDFTSNPLIKQPPPPAPPVPLAKGYGVADFNMDRAFSSGRGTVAGYAGQRQWRDAVFAQDDWKVLPNLTLNLGLRWEYDQPIYEVNNKQSNVNMQTGELEIAGQNGNSRALYNPVWTNFMPRVGFSYNPLPRIVVRGGFGSTIYMEGTGANLRLIINPPFQTATDYAGGAPVNLSNPGEFTTAEKAFSAHSADCNTLTDRTCGITVRAWNHNLHPSTINEFSLTTEYQVSNTASFQIGYVGETGVHLINANNGNQLTHPCFAADGTLLTYNSAACFAVNKAPFYKLVGQSGFLRITDSEGMMNYNALQATFRQRLSHGLQFTANYTFSKSMTNSTGYFGSNLNVANNSSYPADPHNLSLEYGLAPTDATHNLNFHLVYQLPFGRDRMFGSHVNRAVDEVIGGWRVSMAGFAYTGLPVTVTSTNTSGVRSGQQRAIHYRKLVIKHRNINQWYGDDPSATPCPVAGVDNGVCAYGVPANGTISPSSKSSERAPGYQQYNAAAFKDFSITDNQRLTFRVDAFNVFNIASYGNPTATVPTTQFGAISSVRSGPRTLQLSAKYTF
ncbi:MAG TPA: TonB-dependent receptor [Edaphobacter sp.]|nr:TonB-dependent receptor [Edaphobacter sp.]